MDASQGTPSVCALRIRLCNDIRSSGNTSSKVPEHSRQWLRSLCVGCRQQVVDGYDYMTLRECKELDDIVFLIEECSATIFGGGWYCPLCKAIDTGDADRVSIYIEYLLGRRGRVELQRHQLQCDAGFLTGLFIGRLIPEPYSAKAAQIADILFDCGACPKSKVNGGTALEWAVRFRAWPWISYILSRGAVPCCSPCDNEQDALYLAAILGDRTLYDNIRSHPSMAMPCLVESDRLWDAASMISVTYAKDELEPVQISFNSRTLATPFESGLFRSAPPSLFTNRMLNSIIHRALFVQHRFGDRMPPFFAERVLLAGCAVASRTGAAASDIVELLAFLMDFLEESTFASGEPYLMNALRNAPNDLRVSRVLKLIAKYCRIHLLGALTGNRRSAFALTAMLLLELALKNAESRIEAIDLPDSSLENAALLAVAVGLSLHEPHANSSYLNKLIESLVASRTYVGLPGMIVTFDGRNDDTPLSTVIANSNSAMKDLMEEAACCQINCVRRSAANTPKHWKLPSLVCLAARALHRGLDSEDFDRLPDVLINARGSLIKLPYLVASHSAGLKRSQRLDVTCACSPLNCGHIFDAVLARTRNS